LAKARHYLKKTVPFDWNQFGQQFFLKSKLAKNGISDKFRALLKYLWL